MNTILGYILNLTKLHCINIQKLNINKATATIKRIHYHLLDATFIAVNKFVSVSFYKLQRNNILKLKKRKI